MSTNQVCEWGSADEALQSQRIWAKAIVRGGCLFGEKGNRELDDGRIGGWTKLWEFKGILIRYKYSTFVVLSSSDAALSGWMNKTHLSCGVLTQKFKILKLA